MFHVEATKLGLLSTQIDEGKGKQGFFAAAICPFIEADPSDCLLLFLTKNFLRKIQIARSFPTIKTSTQFTLIPLDRACDCKNID